MRFRKYLEKRQLWDAAREERLAQEISDEVLSTLKAVENIGPPPRESLFEDVYATVPWHLQEQREELLRYLQKASAPARGVARGLATRCFHFPLVQTYAGNERRSGRQRRVAPGTGTGSPGCGHGDRKSVV